MKKKSENELSNLVIGTCIQIHKTLGPGLLESVCEKALTYELHTHEFNALLR